MFSNGLDIMEAILSKTIQKPDYNVQLLNGKIQNNGVQNISVACDFKLNETLVRVTTWNVTPLLGDFGGSVGIYRFSQSPPIPRSLPSLFSCRELFSFCHFNSMRARLQARGLAQRTAISASTRVKCITISLSIEYVV